jgi:hypothetical protein
MKRLIFVLLCCVLLAGTLWAQPCTYQVSTSDGTCTSNHNCVSTTGCAVVTFTPTCSGWYKLEAWTGDGQTNCCYGAFNSCVNVYDNGVRIANCHITSCNTGGCYRLCEDAVCLIADHEYELYVCLVDCELQTCGMPPPCTAYGRVKFHTSANCQ